MSERNFEQRSRIQSITRKFVPTERVVRSVFIGSFVGLSELAVYRMIGIEKSNDSYVAFGAGAGTGTYLFGLGKEKIPAVYRKVIKTITDRKKLDAQV